MTSHTRTFLTTAMAVSLLTAGFTASAAVRADRDGDQHRQKSQASQPQARSAADRDRDARSDRGRRDDRHDRDDRDDRNDREDRRHDSRSAGNDARQREQRAQEQRRLAQYRYQQAYNQRVRADQARRAALRYNYTTNPYRNVPAAYRYNRGGAWYTVNHYGADMLRQAVNQGYEQGLRAGRADRNDRWQSDYRRSRGWIDGSYGYDNYYVSRGDYQYYFRQGFERGYQDGYNSRYRYGRSNADGSVIILAAVLTSILGLQAIN